MWSRSDLKMRGKTAFYRNYWSAVAVSVIMSIVTELLIGSRAKSRVSGQVSNADSKYDQIFSNPQAVIIGLVFSMIFLVIGLIVAVIKIFIGNLLTVGGRRFYMENRERDTKISTIFHEFKRETYGNVVLIMFLRDLFTGLWTLLFIVPGVVKYYEYCMIPYILSENPGMNRKKAFEISKQMMDGQKMNAFLLDLSFVGWWILSFITCGIVAIFYANPYMEATWAELYAVYRVHAFHRGSLTTADLPGFGTTQY
ncbi:MAG: DUF975 family protein [Lachnospiraceae bacterium]